MACCPRPSVSPSASTSGGESTGGCSGDGASVAGRTRRRSTSSTRGIGRSSTRAGSSEMPVAAAAGVLQRLQRRRGRAEHHRGPGLLAAHHRQVARLVAELLVLLERGVVLLVDDEEAGGSSPARTPRSARRPRCRTVARAQTLPVEEPLAVRSPLCSTATALPKRLRKRPTSCGVRAISGTRTSAAPAPRQRVLRRPQVHLGLAAAGDALEEEGLEAARVERGLQLLQRHGLRLGEALRARLPEALAPRWARWRRSSIRTQPRSTSRCTAARAPGTARPSSSSSARPPTARRYPSVAACAGARLSASTDGAPTTTTVRTTSGLGSGPSAGSARPGRKRGPQRLAERVAVVAGGELHQRQHVVGQGRRVLEERRDRFQRPRLPREHAPGRGRSPAPVPVRRERAPAARAAAGPRAPAARGR